MNKKQKILHPIYGIITEEFAHGRDCVAVAAEMIAAGIKIIQYREKNKSKKEKYEDCLKLRRITEERGITFIVNDDVDVALTVHADGVHIGQGDRALGFVRKVTGNNFIVGVSASTQQEALAAESMGADYIGVGPIYSTKTKKDAAKPAGLELLDFVVKNIKIPFVVIGGIKRHNLPELIKHGACCFAFVTEIISVPDIKARVKEIDDIIQRRKI